MALAENEEYEASVVENELVDELAPLLSNGTEPALYKTISRRSDAGDLPPDDADLELAKQKQEQVRTADSTSGVYATISVLLLGVFVSQTDQSLVLTAKSRRTSTTSRALPGLFQPTSSHNVSPSHFTGS